VSEAAAAEACRALVVTGDGPAFCAGIDVKVVPRYDAGTRRDMVREVNRAIGRLYGLPKPTVAAVNGHALGAGLVLVLACDFRLGTDGSYQLGLPEITAGIPFPAAPMLVVRSELPQNVARSLTLTGVSFGPRDGPAAAFLDEVVPPDRLLEAAIARARSASELRAFATVKRQLKAEALRRIEEIVDGEADPMLREWF
jgi:enoyl-CoA hydratase